MMTKNLLTLALGCAMIASPAYLAAQQDQSQDSVADAARKAQADKKNAPKPKRVLTNDNLDTLTGTINIMGEAPAAPETTAKKTIEEQKKPEIAATEEKKTTAEAPEEKQGEKKDEGYWRKKFTDANKKLADDQHELDIMQREYNLKQQQFYTDPMASLKESYSRQDLNDSKTKIDEKTVVVAQDKTDISDLEDGLRKAGGDPGWETPAAAPAQPAQQ